MKEDPKSVWISIGRDAWDTRDSVVAIWADPTQAAAKNRVRALNAKDSWLSEMGFVAYVVGEFRAVRKRKAART